MFATKVAKPQTKAAEVPTSKLAPRRDCDPVEQALFLQRSIGNQATLRLLTQRALRTEQEIAPENITTREAPRGASWDFSKNSVFPCDRADQPRVGFSLTAPPLPGVIQPKLVIGQVNDPLEHEADRVADQVVRMSGAALSSASAA